MWIERDGTYWNIDSAVNMTYYPKMGIKVEYSGRCLTIDQKDGGIENHDNYLIKKIIDYIQSKED